MKKLGMKFRAFCWALISVLSCIILNAFTMKAEGVFVTGLWGIVTLYGMFAGTKLGDDIQRGLNFKPKLYNGGKSE